MENFFFSLIKAKVTPSSRKIMLSCFWDCEAKIITEYLKNRTTITGDYYSGNTVLIKLRSEVVRRKLVCPLMGSSYSLTMSLRNVQRSQQAVQTAERCGCEILSRPAYSLDFASTDLFSVS